MNRANIAGYRTNIRGIPLDITTISPRYQHTSTHTEPLQGLCKVRLMCGISFNYAVFVSKCPNLCPSVMCTRLNGLFAAVD